MLHVPSSWDAPPLVVLCLAFFLLLSAWNVLPVTAAVPSAPARPLARALPLPTNCRRLQTTAGSPVTVSRHPTTGAVHFVTVDGTGDLYPALTYTRQPTTAQLAAKSNRFFADYGALFGISPAAEMRFAGARQDAYGANHLAYQEYGGPPAPVSPSSAVSCVPISTPGAG